MSVSVWSRFQFNWHVMSLSSTISAVDVLDENYTRFSIVLHVGFVVGRVILAQVFILALQLQLFFHYAPYSVINK